MHDHLLQKAGAADAGRGAPASAESSGLNFPRVYDLLLRLLTRGRERQYREDLLDLAGVQPGHCVLDIGCGTGTQAIATHRRAQPGGSVIGVDVSEKMLAVARRKAGRTDADIAFQRADATRLPFENGRFDVVTITTAMHMLPSNRRQLCLSETARVLKDGGRLLLIDYAGHLNERRHWSARHGRHGLFDLHDLRPALSDLGFAEIDGGPLAWLSLHFLRATKR